LFSRDEALWVLQDPDSRNRQSYYCIPLGEARSPGCEQKENDGTTTAYTNVDEKKV